MTLLIIVTHLLQIPQKDDDSDDESAENAYNILLKAKEDTCESETSSDCEYHKRWLAKKERKALLSGVEE